VRVCRVTLSSIDVAAPASATLGLTTLPLTIVTLVVKVCTGTMTMRPARIVVSTTAKSVKKKVSAQGVFRTSLVDKDAAHARAFSMLIRARALFVSRISSFQLVIATIAPLTAQHVPRRPVHA